jgi:ATP citrate (pro-S)-lyase
MSAKSILEADGKAILNYHLTRAPVIKPSPLPKPTTHNPPAKLASLYFPEDADISAILDAAEASYPWLLAPGAKFVAKPDQLIKRRGKSGLLALNKTWPEAKAWIAARAGKPQKVETVVGVLRQFLVEPFVPHPDGTEYYININSQREVRLISCGSFVCYIGGGESGMEISKVARIRAQKGRDRQEVPCIKRSTKSGTILWCFILDGKFF